jgi:hypothetical protein
LQVTHPVTSSTAPVISETSERRQCHPRRRDVYICTRTNSFTCQVLRRRSCDPSRDEKLSRPSVYSYRSARSSVYTVE